MLFRSNGKTPEVTLGQAKEMGYAVSIVPGLLLASVIGAVDQALEGLKREQRHPVPIADLGPREMFNRVGALEWDPLRTRYR